MPREIRPDLWIDIYPKIKVNKLTEIRFVNSIAAGLVLKLKSKI